MAYEPTNWVCGDIVTADKLNNMEEGIQEALTCCESGGGTSEPLIVNVTKPDPNYAYYVLDKTYNEILEVVQSGKLVYCNVPTGENYSGLERGLSSLGCIGVNGDNYAVKFNYNAFNSESADGELVCDYS